MMTGLQGGGQDSRVDRMDHALLAVISLAAVDPFRVLVAESDGEGCPGRGVWGRSRDECRKEAVLQGLARCCETRLDHRVVLQTCQSKSMDQVT